MKQISEILDSLSNAEAANLAAHCSVGLSEGELQQLADDDVPTYKGKVRDIIFRGDELSIVHSDRLSAFDRYIGLVPHKGTILTDISAWWHERASEVLPTHLRRRSAARVLEVDRCEPIKAEVIVRGYLAGSMLRAYEKGERTFCGVVLPDGLQPHGPLASPIITPTTKAAAFEHDEDTTPEELMKSGVCTQAEWDEIAKGALELFHLGQEVYGELGWILVDTKYEFGRTKDGSIKVIDEIHTPDSSRLWVKDSYQKRLDQGQAPEMLDKEIVRRYLSEQGFQGEGDVPHVPAEKLVELAKVYLTVAERLRGEPLLTDA